MKSPWKVSSVEETACKIAELLLEECNPLTVNSAERIMDKAISIIKDLSVDKSEL